METLLAAIREADENTVHTLLDSGADPNRCDAQGLTPLAHAVLAPKASLGVIRALRHAGARLNLPSGLEGKAIDALLTHYPQWPDLFEIFLEIESSVPEVRSRLMEVLQRVAMLDGTHELQALLDRFSPLSPSEAEATALIALDYGFTTTVDLLKKAGFDVPSAPCFPKARAAIKLTPLMDAASELQVDVIEELMAAGASLEPRDAFGRDVFDHLRLGLADLRFWEFQNEPKDPDAENKYRRIRARFASAP